MQLSKEAGFVVCHKIKRAGLANFDRSLYRESVRPQISGWRERGMLYFVYNVNINTQKAEEVIAKPEPHLRKDLSPQWC